jgi:nucleotide-binding universal stress UspA family protein
MLRTVLLPIDFSAESDLVMRFCTGLADLGVRRVVACNVVAATGLDGPETEKAIEVARDRMRTATKPLSDAGLDVEVRIPTGDAEHALLALATEGHVDAVVCGSSGKSLEDRLAHGSVSEALASTSGIPALTVRYDLLRTVSDPAALARGFGRLMLVPTDFSGTAARASVPTARALNVALSVPKRSVGTIRLLHVLAEAKDVAKAMQQETGAEFQLRNLVAIAKERGLSATPVIGHGTAEKAILNEADASRVSSVVIGSRGRTPYQESIMGSVSMTLMRQAPCPVLIVP